MCVLHQLAKYSIERTHLRLNTTLIRLAEYSSNSTHGARNHYNVNENGLLYGHLCVTLTERRRACYAKMVQHTSRLWSAAASAVGAAAAFAALLQLHSDWLLRKYSLCRSNVESPNACDDSDDSLVIVAVVAGRRRFDWQQQRTPPPSNRSPLC